MCCSDKTPAALFFRYNTQLGPPYQVIIDTNFINFSIRNKIDVVEGMMDCLYAECKPCITDCVLAELEKLGQKYRVALKIAKVSTDLFSVVLGLCAQKLVFFWNLTLEPEDVFIYSKKCFRGFLFLSRTLE